MLQRIPLFSENQSPQKHAQLISAPLWAWWYLKSLLCQLFVKEFAQAKDTENIIVGPLSGESTDDQMFAVTKG